MVQTGGCFSTISYQYLFQISVQADTISLVDRPSGLSSCLRGGTVLNTSPDGDQAGSIQLKSKWIRCGILIVDREPFSRPEKPSSLASSGSKEEVLTLLLI